MQSGRRSTSPRPGPPAGGLPSPLARRERERERERVAKRPALPRALTKKQTRPCDEANFDLWNTGGGKFIVIGRALWL